MLTKHHRRAKFAAASTRLRLFGSSYAPLFGLLALRFEAGWLRIGLGVVACLLIADTIRLVLWVPRSVAPSPYTVVEVRDEGAQVSGYLATYLLPFLAVPSPSGSDLAAYALFLAVAGLVSVRSGLTHINPTLYLLGLRLVTLATEEGFRGFAVLRSDYQPGEVLDAVHLDLRVLVEVQG